MRKRKCQDPGQTSQRSCRLWLSGPTPAPARREEAPQTPPGPQTSCPRGLEKPHPMKGSSSVCGSADTHSRLCPHPETGLAQSGPAVSERKGEGSRPAQGQMGACRGHVTRTRSQVSMFLGVRGGQPGRPSLCVMVSWVWCCPLLGGSCPGGPPPIRGSEPQAPRPAALFPPAGLSCTRFL